jgi:5'-nucleotidase
MTRAALLTLAALAAAGPAAADGFRLTVLHVNDFHSRIEPINRFDSTCGPDDEAKGECFGGAARLKTAVDARRAAAAAEGRASLLLDAGDQFQGSLFYTTYKEKAAAEVMTTLGVDAMTLGNHEFDDGPATAAALVAAVPFPVLAANLDVSAEPAFAAPLAPHAVLEAGGRRVGVIGALTPDTAEIASPGPNVAFEDEVAALTRSVAALEAEGVDVIVALTHVGLARDLEIAAAVPGLDLIVGGHSHTLLSDTAEGAAGPYPLMAPAAGGGTVPVVHAYAYGKYLGEVTLTLDDAGRVTAAEGEPILLDAAVAPDPAVAARWSARPPPRSTAPARPAGRASARWARW